MRTTMRLAPIIAIALAAAACTETLDYDPATAGDEEGDRAPRAKTSTEFVRGVYADLLGRTPETFEFVVTFSGVEALRFRLDEEAQLTNVLDGLGDSLPMRNLIVNGILHSTEITIPDKASVAEPRDYIGDQFRRLLGREPNAYELESFAGEWASDPDVGPRTIIRAIIGSREYQSK